MTNRAKTLFALAVPTLGAGMRYANDGQNHQQSLARGSTRYLS
jgi:hypothetical protein